MSPSAPETSQAATSPTIRPRQVSLTEAEGDYFGDPNNYNAIKDGELRRRVVWPVMAFFAFANLLVYALIWVAFEQDTRLIEGHLINASQRVVTSATIGELIGGTAVQLGAIALAVARSIFPSSGFQGRSTSDD